MRRGVCDESAARARWVALGQTVVGTDGRFRRLRRSVSAVAGGFDGGVGVRVDGLS